MPPFIVLKKLLQRRLRARAKLVKEKFNFTSRNTDGNIVDILKNISHGIKREETQYVCRVCLKDGHKYIFDDDSGGSLAEKIREHAHVNVMEDDSFPKYLCESCHALLEAAIRFRSIAQQSERSLREADRKSQESKDVMISESKQEVEAEYRMTQCLPEDGTRSYSDADEPDGRDKSVDLNLFECKKCNISFNNHNEYFAHRKSAEHACSRVRCAACGVSVSKFYLATHTMRVHSAVRPYVCDVCGRGFVTKSAFHMHALTHTEELPYACADCPYRSRTVQSLSVHRRRHTGEKPYSCPACPARCRTKSNLNKHARTHNKLYSLQCGECNKGFHTARELKEHQTQHTGLKEHVCDICGKEFGYRKAMMKHKRRVHHTEKGHPGQVPLYLQFEKKKKCNSEVDSELEEETVCKTKLLVH